ncbi:MAG: Rne/Rng family ribonuclease [Salinivirgaceae bacterium]|nr:Rne/Rng family ribonuclease [Salinivirgaceae bacterium]
MSNTKELIIDVSASEITLALLEDKRIVELYKDHSDNKLSVGDIYLGRVKKIMPGLNAAFVNVGHEKDAFLHYLDLGPQIRSMNKIITAAQNGKVVTPLSRIKPESDIDKNGKIGDVLIEGQLIAVQIAKEPISTKGPRLCSEISIAGRNIVLMPFSNKVSISQKITSSEEKLRLKNLLTSIKPKNYGVIIRTVAETQRVAGLDQELRELVERWEGALNKLKGKQPPKIILGEMNRTTALLRDLLNDTFTSIYVNDAPAFNQIKEYILEIAPDKQKIVKLYQGKAHIFEQFDISRQIKAHFGRTVAIKKGAYLVIEHTEALHVIDVNSGNRSKAESDQENNAFDVNIAAAEEIARQLRLRDMGGIVVIDFIDLNDQEHRQKLYDYMKEIMSKDRAKHQILPLSKFGLMQITRQRVRPVMNIKTTESCPVCHGKGSVQPTIMLSNELENRISYYAEVSKTKEIRIIMHPYLHAYLTKGIFNKMWKWRFKYKIWINLVADHSLNFLEYHVFDKKGTILK